jgi:ELWxxDGT repeat protein
MNVIRTRRGALSSRLSWCGAAALPALANLAAQDPTLLRDINTENPRIASANPWGYKVAGQHTYFAATSLAKGRELWRVDSTGRAELVRDIRAGAADSTPLQITALGAAVLFTADDGASGRELWRSDGTPGGTQLVIDLALGATSSSPDNLIALGNRVFFTAATANALSLWVTDGTAAGTARLASLNRNFLGIPVVQAGRLWFAAFDAADQLQVWQSDATTAGTRPVTTLAGDNITGVAAHAGAVFFSSRGATSASLTRIDPATLQSQALANTLAIEIRAGWSAGPYLYAIDSERDGGSGDLWRTDGTVAGTARVRGNLGDLLAASRVGNELYFAATTFAGPTALWRTDGTTANTREIARNVWGNGEMLTVGAYVVFKGFDSVHGAEPWVTDGSVGGTRLLSDLMPGASSSQPLDFTLDPTGARVLFTADAPLVGRELFATDGTVSGTALFADIQPGVATASAAVASLVAARHRAFFAADDGRSGRELWVTDGSTAGTVMVADLSPGAASTNPEGLAVAGDRVFFAADDGLHGRELWVSDGTASGTQMVLDAVAGPGNGLPAGITPIDDRRIVCAMRRGNPTADLLVSDGTTAGTYAVDLNGGHSPHDFAVVGSTVFFIASHPLYGEELWATDSVTARLVRDIRPGQVSGVPVPRFAAFGGRVYFMGNDGQLGAELWVSDGTAAGTRLLADLTPGAGSSGAFGLTVAGGRLFWHAWTGSTTNLYVTDGTTVTQLLALANQPLSVLVECAGQLLFTSLDGRLWRSDGTATGTVVVDNFGRPASVALRVGSRNAVLRLADAVLLTDGTAAGSRVFGGLTAPTIPQRLALLGDRVLFAADDSVHGQELFQLRLGATAAPIGFGCHHGNSTVALSATDPVLGGNLALRVADVPAASAIAVTQLGVLAARALPFAGGCAVQWDLGGASLALPMLRSGADFVAAIPVPATADLLGQRVVAQGVVAPFPVSGIGVSNGQLLTLGR